MAGHRQWRLRHHAVSGSATAPGTSTDALDGLLDEVRELRLTFVADLATAAGAVEEGATDVAADIVDGDRQELARFLLAADDRLRELERVAYRSEPPADITPEVIPIGAARSSRVRRRVAIALPAVPLVGALTMAAAAAAGLVHIPGTGTTPTPHHVVGAISSVPALQQFESVVNGDPSAQQVIAAADKLHQQIVALIATSNGDPAQDALLAQVLQAERTLLLSKQPPGAMTVLAATRSLITQLQSHATTPLVAPPIASPSTDVYSQSNDTSTPAPSPTASSKPSSTPAKTTKPSPSPTHSSSPSSSPTPSSSPSTGPLPKVGG